MSEKLLRMQYLIKDEGLLKLKSSTVMICGVGGVGSFVAEALARSGVGKLILVDFDTIDISNLNRQLETTNDNIGFSKVKEMAKRIKLVSDCEVEVKECFIDENFKLEKVDYVVDAIDILCSKFALVKMAHRLKIPIVSSLGAARRLNPDKIIYTTLDKTRNDPLAKNFRNLVKKEKYLKKIKVVYSDTAPLEVTAFNKEGKTRKAQFPLGSSIMVVGSIGLKIAAIVIEELLKEK